MNQTQRPLAYDTVDEPHKIDHHRYPLQVYDKIINIKVKRYSKISNDDIVS